jgi:hypothetical protein
MMSQFTIEINLFSQRGTWNYTKKLLMYEVIAKPEVNFNSNCVSIGNRS